MPKIVAIGKQDFEKLRQEDGFYIDKTYFIREWWENLDDVTLITRPRRFGKTLMLSMVEKFFSVEYAGRVELFEHLAIWNDVQYRKLQGTYPVISLSFSDVKDRAFGLSVYRICQILQDAYLRNYYLMDSDLLTEGEKQYFKRMADHMPAADAPMAINRLSNYLYRYYGKRVIILLDEYDTPMQEAYVGGYWDKMAEFIRVLFNSAFKTNPYLERAIMTGITRVSKESIFSDLNNLNVVTASSELYADCFGFTQAEVSEALKMYGASGEEEEVKLWYDGFKFGSASGIYNPWSIINFLKNKKFDTYWANTSSNHLVSKLLQESNAEIKKSFEDLLSGRTIDVPMDEQIVFNRLEESESALWSLLVSAGYLKLLERDFRGIGKVCLTNYEVKLMFDRIVRNWFEDIYYKYTPFIQSMLRGDVQEMNAYINDITIHVLSYFDVGGKRARDKEKPERFYHGFVLGLLVELQDRYVLTSNRESGYGRYDIVLEPENAEDHAIIIEFKVFDAARESCLEDTALRALQQIDDRRYVAGLIGKGISEERIWKYGFAFRGKEVLIKVS